MLFCQYVGWVLRLDQRWPVCATLGLGFTQDVERPRVSLQPGADGMLDIRPSLDPFMNNAG
jgi:hypothetical protein